MLENDPSLMMSFIALKNSMLNFGKVILLVRRASARQRCPPDFDRMTNPAHQIDRESLVEDDSTALVPGEQNEQRASEQVPDLLKSGKLYAEGTEQ
ncbi:hypothetical protein OROMI_019529 [Orobanche minor]